MSALVFLHGALTAMCLIAGVFFLRYWRISKDTFFIWFACAFWTFALNWLLRAVAPGAPSTCPISTASGWRAFCKSSSRSC